MLAEGAGGGCLQRMLVEDAGRGCPNVFLPEISLLGWSLPVKGAGRGYCWKILVVVVVVGYMLNVLVEGAGGSCWNVFWPNPHCWFGGCGGTCFCAALSKCFWGRSRSNVMGTVAYNGGDHHVVPLRHDVKWRRHNFQ